MGMYMSKRFIFAGASLLLGSSICVAAAGGAGPQTWPTSANAPASVADGQALLDRYCVTFHNGRLKVADLELDAIDLANVGEHAEVLEQVVRKMWAGAMPPPLRPRPEKAVYEGFRTWVEGELDQAALANPDPGRSEAFQRLN